MMENAEEIFNFLDEFSKRKPKTIPQELNEYLAYVARTGDPVYQWSLVKSLFKEKLLNVITDFYETTPSIEIPPYPNVDPFNYDIMKNSLLERLDSFTSAPFTVQRICELLTFPRKQYNRVDKFMRAIEKNILVVSTREPGHQRHPEPENGEPMEPIVNGSDNNSEYNVDVEMEDMSWKDNAARPSIEPQPSSSDSHISVDDIEARLHVKQETSMDTAQDKVAAQYESVTPPELNVTETANQDQPPKDPIPVASTSAENKNESPPEKVTEPKEDVEMKCDSPKLIIIPEYKVIIPEIKIDNPEVTEQKLNEQSNISKTDQTDNQEQELLKESVTTESTNVPVDENSSDSNKEVESKTSSEVSSSEESSSSSDGNNTDGNSNSPKTEEQIEVHEEPQIEVVPIVEKPKIPEAIEEDKNETQSIQAEKEISTVDAIQSDNYSISDVQSELPAPVEAESKPEELKPEESPVQNEDIAEVVTPEIVETKKIAEDS